MTGRKPAKKGRTEINISVGGDVTGNILLGDENTVGQRSRLWYWIAAGAGGLVLAFVLFAAWRDLNPRPADLPPLPGAVTAPTSTPVPPGAWKVEVFDNIHLDGSPLGTFAQPAEANGEGGYQVSFTPQDVRGQFNALPDGNYSLRLAGTFEFQPGYYEFHCEHHDGCRVYVDGRNWIDAWWDGGGGHDLARDLPAGKHVVMVEFYDKSGYGLLEVRWRIKP